MPDDGFVQFNKHIIEYMRGVYVLLLISLLGYTEGLADRIGHDHPMLRVGEGELSADSSNGFDRSDGAL